MIISQLGNFVGRPDGGQLAPDGNRSQSLGDRSAMSGRDRHNQNVIPMVHATST